MVDATFDVCFWQNCRPRTRFGDAFEYNSQESLEKRHSKKTTFNPSKSLASATRIINQHLFGLQGLSGSKSGQLLTTTTK